jgi:GTPase Era involved in 16S rRNA processing
MPEPFLESDFSEISSDESSLSAVPENFSVGITVNEGVYLRTLEKAIVVGKGGQRIKDISMRARHEMERYLGQKVHLFLFVKIEENWMGKERFLREMFF